MVQYKLIYYDVRARAETSRMLFALAGVEYEDYRFKDKVFVQSPDDEWPKLKPKTPFGHVPVLVVDGKMYGESTSIERYLARKFGFAGKTPEEALVCDSIVDAQAELMEGLVRSFLEKDEAKKATLLAEFYDEKLPAGFKKLEAMVQESGHFVGENLTWADVRFFVGVHDVYPSFNPGKQVLDGFPKLKALFEKVGANERISAWLAKRPKTENMQ